VIEDDNLSYLHLAREDSQEVGAYGIANEVSTRSMAGASPATTIHVPLRSAEGSEMLRFAQHDNAAAAGSTAQNPAALSFRGHALQIADMIRAIREDGTPVVDGQAARRPVEIILGIYESARTHKEVTLP